MTDNERQLMIELKKQGKGYKAISKELGISIGTVASFFKRKGEKEAAGICSCKCCGKKFKQTKGHRQRIFCSDDCRRSWWRNNQDKRNLKAYYECTCKKCGKRFVSYGNRNRKFCSFACYNEFRKGAGSNE